jgi:hypothetical protein
VAEGARLESVYTFTGIGGSNPSLSAITNFGLRGPEFGHGRVFFCEFCTFLHPLEKARTGSIRKSIPDPPAALGGRRSWDDCGPVSGGLLNLGSWISFRLS